MGQAMDRLDPPIRARSKYDNLKPAVTRILKGRNRDEAERFIALRSHYLLTELIAA